MASLEREEGLIYTQDYPLSSIITSEFATTKWRGAMMGAVFAMQGLGQFGAGIIAVIVTAGFKGSLSSAASTAVCTGVCNLAVDKMWRIIIGFGAVPGCIALYFRLTIPETPRYTFDVSRDVVQGGSDIKAYLNKDLGDAKPDEMARAKSIVETSAQLEIPKASLGDFWRHYSQWKYGKVLLGTAGSWFFLDVAFYGVGLNNSTILTAIGFGSDTANVYEYYMNIATGNIILVCAGAIPGCVYGRMKFISGLKQLLILFQLLGYGRPR